MSAPLGFDFIGAPAGAVSADIQASDPAAVIGVVQAGGLFTGSINTAGLLRTMIAAGTDLGGSGRPLIQAESGIGSVIVLGSMIDTDVGVGLDPAVGSQNPAINLLYVAGDMQRSNALAGVWDEAAGGYPNGKQTPVWRKIENASMGVVYVGGQVGEVGPPVGGIASSGDIDYIADSDGPLLETGEDTAEKNDYSIARHVT